MVDDLVENDRSMTMVLSRMIPLQLDTRGTDANSREVLWSTTWYYRHIDTASSSRESSTVRGIYGTQQ